MRSHTVDIQTKRTDTNDVRMQQHGAAKKMAREGRGGRGSQSVSGVESLGLNRVAYMGGTKGRAPVLEAQNPIQTSLNREGV